MPKRVIDFDAMWGSDKIAACAEWAQAEYAWLYGLADPSGCFEVTNLRVIWGRVAAIRRNLTIERLEQIFGEFQDKGLMFVWEQNGKRYAHWTGSDVPGRLPPPSWRMRLERLAPPVPKQQLAEYVSRFARGRAASPGGGFRMGARREEENCEVENSKGKKGAGSGAFSAGARHSGDSESGRSEAEIQENVRFEISNLTVGAGSGNLRAEATGSRGGLKGGVEEAQEQDLDLDWNWERNEKRDLVRDRAAAENAARGEDVSQTLFSELNSNANSGARSSSNANSNSRSNSNANALLDLNANAKANSGVGAKVDAESSLPAGEFADANVRGDWNAGGNASGNVNSRADGAYRRPGIEDEDSIIRGGTTGAGENAEKKAGWNAARYAATTAGYRDKADLLARELRVGQGPSSCGPVRVKPEALERIRLRNAGRDGSRSP